MSTDVYKDFNEERYTLRPDTMIAVEGQYVSLHDLIERFKSNAELSARVEELERQRPAANRAEHCTVEREDGRICGGSIEVDEDGDIACEFCRSRAHIAKLAAACSAKDEALAEIRPEVRMFAVQMEAKLKANDHKPGWKDDDLYDLKLRCDEELAELGTAIRHDAHPDVIVSEAADVANFAMMIADNAQRALLRARGGA